MGKSISRVISEFAVNLKYDDLPKEVINDVMVRIILPTSKYFPDLVRALLL